MTNNNSGMQKWERPGDSGSKINSELEDYLVDRWGNKNYGKHWYELRVQVSSSNPTLHLSLEELYRASSSFDPEHSWEQCQECLKQDCPTIREIAFPLFFLLFFHEMSLRKSVRPLLFGLDTLLT